MRRACCSAILAVFVTAAMISLPGATWAQQSGPEKEYTLEQVKATPAEVFLQRLAKPEPGYEKFAAIRALGLKARLSDPNEKWEILNKVAQVMYDRSRSVDQRFKCCYVISDSNDEQWAPALIYVLLNDPNETMRSVAACASAKFSGNAEIREGLLQASRREKSQKVLDDIYAALNKGDAEYTVDQIKQTPVERFLDFMAKPEPGYAQFAAQSALGKKAKMSDENTRRAIMATVVAAMNDASRSEQQRFQCCYVISTCGDPAYVPYLIDVLQKDPSVTMRTVAAEALGDFRTSDLARQALSNAAETEKNERVLGVIQKRLSTNDYSNEQIANTSAEQFLEWMVKPEPGYASFAAMRALGKKAKMSDTNGRRAIMELVVATMNDKSRSQDQRFQCCYVISESGDDYYAPHLIDVLNNDPSTTMRSVAAEALADFAKNPIVRSALLQAAAQETNEKVLEVLNRVIAKMNAR